MVGLVDHAVLDGRLGTFNTVMWRCGSMDRVCASSLAAESNIMSSACHQTELVQNAYSEITNAKYDSSIRKNLLRGWEASIETHL